MTGKEIIEAYGLQPYELILEMAKGLSARNKAGDRVQGVAKLLALKDKCLFQDFVVHWPKEDWDKLQNRCDQYIPPCYNYLTKNTIKDVFVKDLSGFIFEQEDVEKMLGKLPTNENKNIQTGQEVETMEASQEKESPRLAPLEYATPVELVDSLKKEGIRDAKELASEVDKCFKLSNAELGRLLPARPGTTLAYSSERDRGARLRGKKK